jgi:hypothetical protein
MIKARPPSANQRSRHRHPTRRRPIARLAILALAAGSIMIGVALPASADTDVNAVYRKYSYSSDDCAHKKDYSDPIGVMFVGQYAGFKNVSDQIGTHTNWDHAGGGSPDQRVWVKTGVDGNGNSEYACRTQNGDRSNHGFSVISGTQDRFHVRLWMVPFAGNRTVGTPHYEVDNGYTHHCVTKDGFDRGRHRLKEQFKDSHRHKVENAYWGNTAWLSKCGKMVHSNGSVAIIHINHKNAYGQP